MNNYISDAEMLRKFAPSVKGVFSLSDLKALFPILHQNSFYRWLGNLERGGVLKRFTRGLYLASGFDINVLSQKLCPRSYVSFETVLADKLIIGTVPTHELKAVKVGKRREYRSSETSIIQLGIDEGLYFGFDTVDGVNIATKEKALLDTLYFYNKGVKFYFDIFSDVDLGKIDEAVMKKYLTRYKNPKFVTFVKNYLKEGQS